MSYKTYGRPKPSYRWRDAFYDVVALGTAASIMAIALMFAWVLYAR